MEFFVCIFGGGLAQPVLNKRQIKTNYEVSLANQEKKRISTLEKYSECWERVSNALTMYTSQDQFITLKKKEMEAYKNR